jgi:hypothetical protein
VPFFVTSSAEVLFAEQLFSTGINVVADTLRPFTPPCASSAYFFVKIDDFRDFGLQSWPE